MMMMIINQVICSRKFWILLFLKSRLTTWAVLPHYNVYEFKNIKMVCDDIKQDSHGKLLQISLDERLKDPRHSDKVERK